MAGFHFFLLSRSFAVFGVLQEVISFLNVVNTAADYVFLMELKCQILLEARQAVTFVMQHI